MSEFDNIKISLSEYDLERGGKGKIAVFMYTGSADPKAVLDEAVSIYVGTQQYYQYIDINMDNPRTRVIMGDINGIRQKRFDHSSDRM